MLEREEDEQPLKHGKGPAERSEQEASPFDEVEVDFSDDEYEHEEDGVHPISLGNRPKIDYSWKSIVKYREDCSKKCYQRESNTFNAYFHSSMQYKLFWGEFINRSMQKS